jgi:hypothetical protein
MADANTQRLVIKIVGDTSELEASLSKLKSTATSIVSGKSTGAGNGGSARGAGGRSLALDPQVAAGISGVSTRLTNLRRETKAVGMDIYRNIGNPFLVVSSMSQRITGIYQLSRDSEVASMRLERINDLIRRAAAQGRTLTVKALLKEFDATSAKLNGLNKQMGGFGMKMRGVADFFVNQFMTAGLFVWFQAMSMLVMGVIDVGGKIARSIIDPMGVAAEKAQELADLVDKLGGLDKVAIEFNISAEDRKAIEVALMLAKQKTSFENRLGLEQGVTNIGGAKLGGYTEDQVKKLRLEAALQAMGSTGLEADITRFLGWDLTYGTGSEAGKAGNRGYAAGMGITRETLDAQAKADYAAQLLTVARELGSLNQKELDTLAKANGLRGQQITDAYTLLKAEKDRVTEIGRAGDELERQRYALTGDKTGLNYGEGAAMDKWFIKSVDASRMIERLQRAQTNFSAQMTARQQRQQLGQAAADVTRAGIGRPGQSGFELAAAVLEARAKAQEAREQIRIQRRQEAIQQKIEYWTRVQTNAKRQQDIMSNAMSIALNNAQMVLTIDPASGNLLARYVAGDVYKLITGAAANNTNGPR